MCHAGQQDITVKDINPAYGDNGPSYTFHYDIAQPVTVYVAVQLAATSTVPSDVRQLVQQALINAFTDGTLHIRLGSTFYASRLICIINALGDWIQVLEVSIGTTPDAGHNALTLPINQFPVITAHTISITLV